MLRPHPISIAFVLALALVLAGCGGDDGSQQETDDTTAVQTTTSASKSTADGASAALARRPAGTKGLRVPAERARIVADDSSFGRILFDANGQVVYVFENDRPSESNCTSAECVQAWPPVLTEEKPSAGPGAEERLLGTIRRDDGTRQVTYNGRPLYFYEHEGPGEILCHNVNLNGGLWWVVTARGEPAD